MSKREIQNRSSGESDGVTGGVFFNLLGIFLALGAALGGLLLVQGRLGQEKENLFRGSGIVTMPLQVLETETQVLEVTEKTILSEDQLLQAVQDLGSGQDVYPHEPQAGQLSMVQAIDCGRDWVEDFFMRHFGLSGTEGAEPGLQEFKAYCYLWSPGEGGVQGKEDLFHSYWTVSFQSREMTAELILNGVSGQVLDASINCYVSLEYQDGGGLSAVLEEYARSFDMETGEPGGQWTQEGILYQPMGSGGIFAAVKTGDLFLCRADDPEGQMIQSVEIFQFHFYLGTL
jgi:hypothetical protein